MLLAIGVFILGIKWGWLLLVGQIVFFSLLILTFAEIFLLFYKQKTPIKFQRTIPLRMNLGDNEDVHLELTSNYPFPIRGVILEKDGLGAVRELPFQIAANNTVVISYELQPKRRGVLQFEVCYVRFGGLLGLLERNLIFKTKQVSAVYPSVRQMKSFEFAVAHASQERGIKKIRQLGHNNEFEHIKNYTQGDELKTINWKASSRRDELMVNQYQIERSQHIYALVDKSRSMKHAFEGMQLLDYAINSTLVLGNIALQKQDKFGVFTFSNKIGSLLLADSGKAHRQGLLEMLYQQKTNFKETNFDLVYYTIRQKIKQRSMLLLFTNFDTQAALERVLPALLRINRYHLLVVVFFEQTDLQQLSIQKPSNIQDVYLSQVAQDRMLEKRVMAKKMNKLGIRTILTEPDQLSVKVINQYLEVKSKGVL